MPDARLADDLDHSAAARDSSPSSDGADARQLVVASDERQFRACDLRAHPAGRARPRTAATGRRLPLTMNGSSAVVSNSVREPSSTAAVARICPDCACAITRAARFTASPITV